MEKINLVESCDATVIRGGRVLESMNIHGHFKFICIDKDGNLKWEDESDNVVTTQGRNNMLDTYLGNTQVAPTSYMSLIVAGAATPASTYVAPLIQEITGNVVTGGLRPVMTWTAAAGNTKAATTTSFSILASATVIGNMVVNGNLWIVGGSNVNAVGNSGATINGVLFSSSNFLAGSKNVSNGDTLNVSYSVSI